MAGECAEVAVLKVGGEGQVTLALGEAETRLADFGVTPLPPYIVAPLADAERYQTIYADREGSAAAPTAGLHFTSALLARLRERGVGWAEATLHVGLDTFRPVTAERVIDHTIHREWCDVPDETARTIAATKLAGRRVIAVGTTAARTLETLGAGFDPAAPRGISGETGVFIYPGYRWRLVDALLTNFHLPRSTLLMMVSALAGTELIRRAYAEAISAEYRFYSFGDAMLVV
jgi:S-adenosylmethionine:tRNA ribosyltransferase-isomerase